MKPSPRQNLVLLRLAVLGPAPKVGELKALMTAEERKDLAAAGLIDVAKGARGAISAALTDGGWRYLNDAGDLALSKSQEASAVLQRFFQLVCAHLNSEGARLNALFTTGSRLESSPSEAVAAESLPAQIRAAYARLSPGQRDGEVRLKHLKAELRAADPPSLDYTLLGMVMAGHAQVRQIADSLAIDDKDRAAALRIGDAPRHLFRLTA
jgi:hypothetical protein